MTIVGLCCGLYFGMNGYILVRISPIKETLQKEEKKENVNRIICIVKGGLCGPNYLLY